MKISILISSFNKGRYLEKCIKSCLNQTYKNYEIILLDNYSNDNTDLILKKYNKFIIIKKELKISSYSAVNQMDILKKAFSISTGEIICLLDADDYFEDNKLDKIYRSFSKNDKIKIIFDKPIILINNKFDNFIIKKKFSKNIWPTTYPTSSINIKKDLLKIFFENKTFGSYPLLEIDFRITTLSKMIYKNFLIIDERLTIYRKVSDGIMSKNKKFSNNWWIKRLSAHHFIRDIYKKTEIIYKKNYDFYLTKTIVYLLNQIIK
tara:strand:+ start:8550 stop:9338 length:789 start_codon:yes stop_codon:yes gene_type:complete